MSDEQQAVAASATGVAVAAHLSGDVEKAAPLFNRATVEHQRAAAQPAGSEPTWRDGHVPLPPMPDAPPITSETDAAVNKLNDMGGRHAELVASWGSDAPVNIEYARSAFREMVASDPGLIAVVDQSGLGDNPAILNHLAKFGRLSAGFINDNTISSRRNNDVTHSPTLPSGKPRAGSSAQNELADLLDANPPGSASYKNPQVQSRVQALSRIIAGSGSAVGQGGRTA